MQINILFIFFLKFIGCLRVRPYSQIEANEMFETYLHIFYYVMNFPEPDENDFDLQGFYKKNASELLSFKKQLDKISKINWVNNMTKCLVEIHVFLSTKQLYGEFTTLDLRVIKYLLRYCPKVYFEDREDGYFLHISDSERYNEFGVELRREYFQKQFLLMNVTNFRKK